MTVDTFAIEGGVLVQGWRDTPAADITDDRQLVEFAPGEAVCGMLWDGKTLSAPVTPEEPEAPPPAAPNVLAVLAGKLGVSPADLATALDEMR